MYVTGCLWQLKFISQWYADPKQHNLVKLNLSLSTFQSYNWDFFRLSTDIWRAVDSVFPILCLTTFFYNIFTVVDSQSHHLWHKSLWERNSQLIPACCKHHVSHQMTLHRKEQILFLFDIKSITGVFLISFPVAHYLLRASRVFVHRLSLPTACIFTSKVWSGNNSLITRLLLNIILGFILSFFSSLPFGSGLAHQGPITVDVWSMLLEDVVRPFSLGLQWVKMDLHSLQPNLLINNGSVYGVKNNKPIWQCSCCNVDRFGRFTSQRERMMCAFKVEMHKHTWAWPKINLNLLHSCSCASLFKWQGECKHHSLCEELASSIVLKKIETGSESSILQSLNSFIIENTHI